MYEPVGKIAGLRHIAFSETVPSTESIWSVAFSGSWSVQAIRWVSYPIAFLFVLFAFIGSAATIETRVKSRRNLSRRGERANLTRLVPPDPAYGVGGLRKLNDGAYVAIGKDRLLRAISHLEKHGRITINADSGDYTYLDRSADEQVESYIDRVMPKVNSFWELIKAATEAGYVSEDKGGMDRQWRDTLTAYLKRLDNVEGASRLAKYEPVGYPTDDLALESAMRRMERGIAVMKGEPYSEPAVAQSGDKSVP